MPLSALVTVQIPTLLQDPVPRKKEFCILIPASGILF
jgi:hypothetical protein